MKELINIQDELKAPKGQRNSFWNYNYRSAEDILNAVKPLLKHHNCTLTISDDMIMLWDRFYIKATAKIINSEDKETIVTWFAREPQTQKGMSESQITWTASSYARKYALNGLFAIDDTKDVDSNEHKIEAEWKEKNNTYGKKNWLNYEDFVNIVEAWNTTEKQITKIIKEEDYTLWWPAKNAVRHYVETGELDKNLFFKK